MTNSIREEMIWTVMRIILLGTTDLSIIQINPPSEREYGGAVNTPLQSNVFLI